MFHDPAHKASTPWGNQKADALAKRHSLATDLSVDTAGWVYQKSGHHSVQIKWCIVKEEVLKLQLRASALESAKAPV